MKLIRKLVCGVALYLLTVDLAAAETYPMVGPGAISCAKFGQAYSENPELTEGVFFSWAQGYMSGINAVTMHLGGAYSDLSALSIPDQKARIRSYCANNPLSDYRNAVIELMPAHPVVERK